MNNSVYVSVDEKIDEPKWIGNVEKFALCVLEKIDVKNAELSVMFCNDELIQSLNNQYRKIDAPTDILSFEQGDENINDDGEKVLSLGDIVISIETLEKNALEFGVAVSEELQRLLIHGILHLAGYDHGEEHIEIGVAPKCEMLVLQEKILSELMEENIIVL